MIAVADTIRSDSSGAVALLTKMNIDTVMVTGDRAATAAVIAGKAGIAKVRAEVLPEEKQQVIRDLQAEGRVVAMVGDGINDAPALTAADIGIAIGAGTEVAIDAADVVVMNRKLTDVCASIDLSRRTLRNIRQNLAWALVYNLFGIPLAAGAFVHLFGWELNPMFGAAAMSVSSLLVVTNALRLNRWRYPEVPGGDSEKTHAEEAEKVHAEEAEKPHAEEAERQQKGEPMKEIVVTVKGMMCEHCEARVRKCLLEIPGVSDARVSRAEECAAVTADDTVSREMLIAAVKAQGYTAE